MKEKINVKELAKLARIEITEHEVSQFEKDIPNILSFVEAIQEAGGEPGKVNDLHRNVMREDEHPHESGIHTDVLLGAAPEVEDSKVKVRRVIKK